MKKLFLDLEGTVIDDVLQCRPLDEFVEKIKGFVARWEPDTIETFSWAFWTEADRQNVPFLMRWLRGELGRDVEFQDFDVHTQRMAFLRAVLGRVSPGEEWDFGGLASKDRVFEWFICASFKTGQFTLIDDTVITRSIVFPRSDLRIDFLNVADF